MNITKPKSQPQAAEWWSSLNEPWQAIFKAAIGINSEPTEDELVAILSLTELKCDRRNLTSLEPLRALTGLQSLNCYHNQLTSLEPLRACTGLRTLNCSSNQLTSLEPLRTLTGLQSLSCSINKLTSLEPLQVLTDLQSLNCWFNQLTSLEPLRACTSFQTLACSSNRLTSLEPLRACPNLRTLYCWQNQLTNLEAERDKIIKVAKLIKLAKLREDAKLIVPTNNHFGFRLFDQLLQQNLGQNVFMSPASVAIALAMTYNGAAGNTQTVMAKTLGLENLTLAEVNQANLALRNVLLHQSDSDVSLLITNSLWLHQDFHLEPAFLTPTQQCYAAKITNADFQSPATISNINQWVKENTQGKIGPVVQTLDPLTVLLVINAIYFKGRWEKPFDRRDTKERDFTLLTGENKRTPMMSQKSFYDYYKGYNYQSVCLPYRGAKKQRFSMTIFLPDRGTPLSNFLLRDHWQEWRTSCNFRKGTIVLPRFKVESEVTLNEVIKRLGMAEAFSMEEANFSQMAKVPKGQNLYLSEVKHQTFVEVNEEGTEAAAVTTVEECDMGRALIPRPFEMIVNHPFFFTIQDDGTGTVVFMGAIVEPK